MCADGITNWRTIEFGPHSFGIEDKNKSLIGLIDLINGRWHVEVLWQTGGDVKADFADHDSAIAFVRDLEATTCRMR